MSKLTSDDVLKLAGLSRLRLSDDEVEEFKKQLSEILDYVEQLDKVDTDGLEPTYQVAGLKSVMRADEAVDYGYKASELVDLNAPDVESNQFKVKRVL